jgi:radical SAM protein with 4Fe4S-binding SPASM domain
MNNLLVRQTKDTFIRRFRNIGYITNQLTRHDRNYDENGAIFLEQISRIPQSIDTMVKNLLKVYNDISWEELRSDFVEFIRDLEINKFVVIGNTIKELDHKEPFFSYKFGNPKTATYNFSSDDKNDILTDSVDFFYDEFHKNPRIFGLQIEVTSRCNERCIHCYIPNSKKNNGIDMDLPLVFKVFDEARNLGTLQLTVSGGEPFLHKDIHHILRYAKTKDFCITILSNLTPLSDQHISLIKEINPSLIQVSLYSMSPFEHDSITLVKGSFEKTKRNLETLVSFDIPVQISCPVMKINQKSYKNVLRYAQSLQIKARTDFILMAQANHDTSNLTNRLNIKETEELLKDIIEVDTNYLDFIRTLIPKSYDIEKFKNSPICGVGADSICLTSNGDYYPCAGWQGMILGNAYNQSLQDVWENSEQIKLLRSVTTNLFPDCIPCNSKDYCAMCLVRNYNENNGNMFKVSKHFCEVASLNKRLVAEYYKNTSPKI